MIKGSPLADAPDAAIDFARSAGGKAVADFMALEQQNIGDWKVDRIVEAAGAGFRRHTSTRQLIDLVQSSVSSSSPFRLPVVPPGQGAAECDRRVRERAIPHASPAQGHRAGRLGSGGQGAARGDRGGDRPHLDALRMGRRQVCWRVYGWRDAAEQQLCLDDGKSPGLEELENSGRLRGLLER